jgi:hypothetical protein
VERGRRRTYGLLAIIGLSTPAALMVETALRHVLMPPEAEALRAWLRPIVTPWVWWTLPATAVAVVLGAWLYRWLLRRELRRLEVRLPAVQARHKAEFEALMLATSAPQLPALAATLAFMCGAELQPVLAAIVAGTLGVLVMGAWVLRAPQRNA